MADGWTYTGAPDECSIHWPTRLEAGFCPIRGCPNSWAEFEKTEAFQRIVDGIGEEPLQ